YRVRIDRSPSYSDSLRYARRLMRRLRVLSAKDVLKAFSSFGFQVAGIRGSHAKLRRTLPSGEPQTLIVPLHKSLAPGTLLAIFRQGSRFIPDSDLKPWFFSEDRKS